MKAWLLFPFLAFAAGYLAGGSSERAAAFHPAASSPNLPASLLASIGERELVPESATSLEEMRRLPSDAHRLAALSQMLDRLSPAGLAALVERLSRHPGFQDYDLLKLAYKRWAEAAPEAALKLAGAKFAEQGRVFRGAYYEALLTRARSDLPAAMAELKSRSFENKSGFIHDLTVQSLVSGDSPPSQALDRLRRMDPSFLSGWDAGDAIRQLARRLYQDDPDSAWRYLQTVPADPAHPDLRDTLEAALFAQRAADNPASGLAYLQSLSTQSAADSGRLVLLQETYVAILAHSGRLADANAYMANLPEGSARNTCDGKIAMGFLDAGNIEGSVAFVQSLPPGEWNQLGFFDFFDRLIEGDCAQGTDLLLSKIGTEGFPIDVLESGMRSAVSNSDSPERTAQLFAAIPMPYGGEMIGHLLYYWTAKDPEAAAQWALNQPDATIRAQSLQSLIDSWLNTAPVQTVEWLQTLPPGPTRDTAVGAYAQATFSDAPDASLDWLRSIQDEATRLKALYNGWAHWPNHPAAEAWAAGASLTDAERAVLEQ